jgi:hypothetical protein
MALAKSSAASETIRPCLHDTCGRQTQRLHEPIRQKRTLGRGQFQRFIFNNTGIHVYLHAFIKIIPQKNTTVNPTPSTRVNPRNP